jgi:hypothetical protein
MDNQYLPYALALALAKAKKKKRESLVPAQCAKCIELQEALLRTQRELNFLKNKNNSG